MKKCIVLVDDHTVLREGIRRVLEDEEDITIIGEAEDGREAVRLVLELLPNVVLMDINMPNLNGIEATKLILRDEPSIQVLILSMYSDQSFVERALKAGVSGYMLKNCAVTEVVTAVKSVCEGHLYLSPEITSIVVEDYVRHVPSHQTISNSTLTTREREILQLIAEGTPTKEIADMLNVSERTVESHRKHIMDKLNIRSVA